MRKSLFVLMFLVVLKTSVYCFSKLEIRTSGIFLSNMDYRFSVEEGWQPFGPVNGPGAMRDALKKQVGDQRFELDRLVDPAEFWATSEYYLLGFSILGSSVNLLMNFPKIDWAVFGWTIGGAFVSEIFLKHSLYGVADGYNKWVDQQSAVSQNKTVMAPVLSDNTFRVGFISKVPGL